MRLVLVLWLALASEILAQTPTLSLSASLDLVQKQAVRLASWPSPTWGEQQAREDLQRLERACQTLVGALTQDPEVTPTQLHPGRDELLICRGRLRASLPLLGSPEADNEALLQELDRVTTCLRSLEYRFDGRAQPHGPRLAQAALAEAVELPIYGNPRELLGEARNVRWLAEALTRLRGAWRGQLSPGVGFGSEFYDFVAAAYSFEYACNADYKNVSQTRSSYRHLVRTYEQMRTFGYGLDAFRWTQLENAFGRLEQFYAAAP